MSKRVLVTGGAGFIGSHLVDKLIELGHQVTVFDSLEPQVHGDKREMPKYLNKECEFIEGDVRNRDSLGKALQKIEIIFHQAATVGVAQSMYEISRYSQVNVLGTANLLDIMANESHQVEKLIVASSMSVYGEGQYNCAKCGVVYPRLRSLSQLEKGEWEMRCPLCNEKVESLPTDEDKPLYPTSVYAISKRDQEEMCLTVGRAYHIPSVALRYFNVYGPRQALSNPYTGIAAIFSSRILNNHSPCIFEDGLQSRDFTHVNDIIQANLLAMQNDKANYQVFNVGTGRSLRVLDIAQALIKELGSSIDIDVVSKYREGDIRHCYADISKIQSVLGFQPRVKFEEGISDLVEWVKRQKAVDQFEKSQRELKEKKLTK
ncbi:dTDP-L-rhamnose 4-epimerase [subsurface metagenome]